MKKNTDLGKSFEQGKEDMNFPYRLKRMELTDTLALMKDGKPILHIPDELSEDFIYLLVRAKGFEKFMAGDFYKKQTENDIPPELFNNAKS